MTFGDASNARSNYLTMCSFACHKVMPVVCSCDSMEVRGRVYCKHAVAFTFSTGAI